MKYTALILSALFLASQPISAEYNDNDRTTPVEVVKNQWNGKKVAYLGDSITDKIHVGTTKNYWQYLEELLGIKPLVLGINGHQWTGIMEQAKQLKNSNENVDAIFIFAGTNDFNASCPIGEWYELSKESVETSGPRKENRMRRTKTMTDKTFRGRINQTMDYLKTNFPTKQIILLTPIHRGYARFGENNIQPDESYPNELGLYVDEYVQVLKEAANVWAVPVIDLNSISGLYPNADSNIQYFHNAETDRLHPNAAGHERMAKAIMYQLLSYPSGF